MNIKKFKNGLKEIKDSFKSENVAEKVAALNEQLKNGEISKDELVEAIKNLKEDEGILETVVNSEEYKIAAKLAGKVKDKAVRAYTELLK